MKSLITITKAMSLLTCFFTFMLLSNASHAQEMQLSLGASAGKALSITRVAEESSATFYSVFGDLVLSEKIIGRLQISSFSASSFTDDLEGEIDSGLEFNGSMGYNIVPSSQPKLHVPLMATLGYANIRKASKSIPGMQVGVTVAPKYMITDMLSANLTLRYLKGVDFDSGTKIDQTDVSIGIMINLL